MLPSTFTLKGALDDVGSICAVEEHLGDLALYVGEHVEDHWKLFRLSSSLQEWSNKFLSSLATGLGHEGALANAKLYAATAEYLVVHRGRLLLQYDQ